MGCVNSTVAVPVDPRTLQVPAITGWDGQVFPFMAVPVELHMAGGLFSVSCSIQPILDAVAMHAQSGYRLTAVFLPVHQVGKQQGRPIDAAMTGLTSATARAMLLFQGNPHEPAVPVESMWYQAPLTVSAGFMGQSASGYDAIYQQLQAAGGQGFALSVMIDQPDARLNGLFSSQTNVNLVCQRRQDMPAMKQYSVTNCPIEISAGLGSIAAHIPSLMGTLQTYLAQGYKVASIYNPPCIRQSGFGTAQTACHIVFEKTTVQYVVCCFDAPFRVSFGFGSSTVDHNQYLGIITQFVQAGWELAALIDMPDQSMQGIAAVASTIKLIFQAATTLEPQASATVGGPTEIQVKVPSGTGPGSVIQVAHPTTGALFQATVPEGLAPGQTFQMRVG